MKKVKVLQLLFLALLLLAWVLLTGELFGQMRPFVMKIFALSSWTALLCEAICTVILAVQKRKKA